MQQRANAANVLAGMGPRPEAPPASSKAVRAVMVGNRGKDTAPERLVRSLLHRRGARFRKHAQPVRGLRCQADIVFPRQRVAVFIDGCFWHACPEHGRVPSKNSSYWEDKLARNTARDRRNTEVLLDRGWTPLRYWEHEPAEAIATDVLAHLGHAANGC